MTLDALIQHLTELRAAGNPGTDVVVAWDPDYQGYQPVTGVLFGDGDTIEILTTDESEDYT